MKSKIKFKAKEGNWKFNETHRFKVPPNYLNITSGRTPLGELARLEQEAENYEKKNKRQAVLKAARAIRVGRNRSLRNDKG